MKSTNKNLSFPLYKGKTLWPDEALLKDLEKYYKRPLKASLYPKRLEIR